MSGFDSFWSPSIFGSGDHIDGFPCCDLPQSRGEPCGWEIHNGLEEFPFGWEFRKVPEVSDEGVGDEPVLSENIFEGVVFRFSSEFEGTLS